MISTSALTIPTGNEFLISEHRNNKPKSTQRHPMYTSSWAYKLHALISMPMKFDIWCINLEPFVGMTVRLRPKCFERCRKNWELICIVQMQKDRHVIADWATANAILSTIKCRSQNKIHSVEQVPLHVKILNRNEYDGELNRERKEKLWIVCSRIKSTNVKPKVPSRSQLSPIFLVVEGTWN